MASGKIRIATCQFAVGASIRRNANRIRSFMRRARRARAEIVHFSECALSGYAGAEIKSTDHLDWNLLHAETQSIMDLARHLKLWLVLGSTHRLTAPRKPHNSLYVINPKGQIVTRYDKRFGTPRDLDHYTPGNRFVTFNLNHVRCSLLICYDLRFPELYRELKKLKVQCIFQSFYNARQPGRSIHSDIMRQTMQCRAATNYFWISMTNSSAHYSPYASALIGPDGKIIDQLPLNRAGIMINSIDFTKEYYDAAGPFRHAALKGALGNGPRITDPRSQKLTTL